MPRRPRLTIAGIPWHIIQRGNNRTACFYAEDDYRYYLNTLCEQAQKHGCAIHAYALMTNHVHLLLTPEKAQSPALLMKHLGQRYVQYINRTYRRSGTLWEGRFRSCLAQEEKYVLLCYRYIEMNPVRANMVSHPREYPWSSYGVNAEGKYDLLISPHELYLALGATVAERQANYLSLFKVDMEADTLKSIRQATNGNYVLGEGRFKDEIEQMLRRRVKPGKAGRPKNHKDRDDNEKLF